MVNDLLRWDCNFEIFFSFLIGQRSNWRKKLGKLFKQWVLCVGVNCVLFLDLLNAGWKTACFNDVKVYLFSRSPDVFHSLFNLGTAPTEWWRRYVLSWFFSTFLPCLCHFGIVCKFCKGRGLTLAFFSRKTWSELRWWPNSDA